MNGSGRDRIWRWLPFLGVALIYLLEMRIDVIDVDSAQYAHIAEEMLRTKSFLVVHNRGGDYLDKPPLTFWLAAASFQLFGVSTWAYKLPSVLSALLAIFSTYRLTRLFHPERIAWLASAMLGSTFAMFMWTNDVRTDTVLLGAAMFAAWQLAEHLVTGRASAFWWGWVGIAGALMAKGPIGAFVPLVAVGAEALHRRRWNWILHPRWLGGVVLCLLLLSPMLWGLHAQYGWKGVTFFFWTQSFGRITGESSWHDTTSPFFFTHTILWEMLPWTPLFLASLIHDLLWAVRRKSSEVLSLAGFFIPFVALSLSHYKLPHYVFITIPFACMMAAAQLERVTTSIGFRPTLALQMLIVLALAVLGYLFCSSAMFSLQSIPLMVMFAVLFVVALGLSLPRFSPTVRLFAPSFVAIFGFAMMLSLHFYPTLLTYQAGSVAAHRLHDEHVPADRVRTFGPTSYALDFLTQSNVPPFDPKEARSGDLWIFTDDNGARELASLGALSIVAELDDFPVSHWSIPFFRSSTRARQVQRRYLIRLSP